MIYTIIFIIGVILGAILSRIIIIKTLYSGDILIADNGYMTMELADESQFEKVRTRRYIIFKTRKKNQF